MMNKIIINKIIKYYLNINLNIINNYKIKKFIIKKKQNLKFL